ncbi:MAG: CPBP family intramembrane glutamic endopeptidase [Clostridia bacterium]|jgi:hypothetical protein
MKKILTASGFILLYLAVYYIITSNITVFFLLAYLIKEVISDPAMISNGGFAYALRGSIDPLIKATILLQSISAVVSFFAYWFISWARKQNFFQVCTFKKTHPANYLASVLLGISLLLPISLLIKLFSIDKLSSDSQELMNSIINGNSLFIAILGIGILAPIIEEVIFRGLILTELKKITAIPAAIIIQGMLFGIYHGNLQQAIYASVLGIVLGYVCVKTGSLFCSILVHIFFNTTSLLMDRVFSEIVSEVPNGASSVMFLSVSITFIFAGFTILQVINRNRESI